MKRPALVIGLATGLSRLLGLAREQLFAGLVGASAFADAYVAAFRLPNLVRDLVAEGAVGQALVPAFVAERERAGAASAYQLGNRVAVQVGVAGVVLAVALALAAPWLMDGLVGAFAAAPGKLELTVQLTRLMAGYLPLVALAAAVMAMATASARYVAPALGPALFNLVSITGAVALALAGLTPAAVVTGWAVVTVVAGAAQLAFQATAQARAGWRPALGPTTPARRAQVRSVTRALFPAMIGAASLQLNLFVATALVSDQAGAVARLHYAFRFLQLPLGVFAAAIATVATTRLAEAQARGDRAAMRAELTSSLRWVLVIGVPAAVGLWLDGAAIVRLVYQHGRFDAADTAATDLALTGLALGLPAYAALKVLAAAWFALDRARLTMVATLASLALNLGVGLAVAHHGPGAVGAATALAASVNVAWLYAALGQALGPMPNRALARHTLRVCAAAAVMGAAVWAARAACASTWAGDDLLARALNALVPVGVGVVVYALAGWLVGVVEIASVLGRLPDDSRP